MVNATQKQQYMGEKAKPKNLLAAPIYSALIKQGVTYARLKQAANDVDLKLEGSIFEPRISSEGLTAHEIEDKIYDLGAKLWAEPKYDGLAAELERRFGEQFLERFSLEWKYLVEREEAALENFVEQGLAKRKKDIFNGEDTGYVEHTLTRKGNKMLRAAKKDLDNTTIVREGFASMRSYNVADTTIIRDGFDSMQDYTELGHWSPDDMDENDLLEPGDYTFMEDITNPHRGPTFWDKAKKSWKLILALGALTGTVLGGGGYLAWKNNQPTDQPIDEVVDDGNNTTDVNNTYLPPALSDARVSHDDAADLWRVTFNVSDEDSNLTDAYARIDIYDGETLVDSINATDHTLEGLFDTFVNSESYDPTKIYTANKTAFNGNQSTESVELPMIADDDPAELRVTAEKQGFMWSESVAFGIEYSDPDTNVESLSLSVTKNGLIYSNQFSPLGKAGNLTDILDVSTFEPGSYNYSVQAPDGSTVLGAVLVADDPSSWVDISARYDEVGGQIVFEGNVTDVESIWDNVKIEYNLSTGTGSNLIGNFSAADGTLDTALERVVASVPESSIIRDEEYTGVVRIVNKIDGSVLSQLPLQFQLDSVSEYVNFINNTDPDGSASSEWLSQRLHVTLDGNQTVLDRLKDLNDITPALRVHYEGNKSSLIVEDNPYQSMDNLRQAVRDYGQGNSKEGARELLALAHNAKDYVITGSTPQTNKVEWNNAQFYITNVNNLDSFYAFAFTHDANKDGTINKTNEAWYINIAGAPSPFSSAESSGTVLTEADEVLANYGQSGLNRYAAETLMHLVSTDLDVDRTSIRDIVEFDEASARLVLDSIFNQDMQETLHYYGNMLVSAFDVEGPDNNLIGSQKYHFSLDAQNNLVAEIL